MMTIADKIKKVRLHRNYTQKYIAQTLGMSHANYGKMENGFVKITPARLERIAIALEVGLEEITCPVQENKQG